MTRPGGDGPADNTGAPDAGSTTGDHMPGHLVPGESVLGETAPCGCPWESGLSTYLDGWLAGQAYGYEQGHADGLDTITPAAEALAALRSTLGPSHEELQRIRRQSRGPARTPAQIRAETSYSWRRYERQLAARQTEHAGQAGQAVSGRESDQTSAADRRRQDHDRDHGHAHERGDDGDDLGAGHPGAQVRALVGAGGGERPWVG